jgi:hypothetical protein
MKDESLAGALRTIHNLLESSVSDSSHFPPTILYNEGWLLRLVLDWFAEQAAPRHPLQFAPGASWYSEARLPPAFAMRYRGDPLAESWTHADGVVGHFEIGSKAKSDLSIRPDATQFLVLEAKLFSRLSRGVTRAPGFDQAARNVACIAEALRRAGRQPGALQRLGFYVVAPQAQIELGLFAAAMSGASIEAKVAQRVQAYEGTLDGWFNDWFLPTMERIDVGAISWEALITAIAQWNPRGGEALNRFYELCLLYNQAAGRSALPHS